MRGVLVLVMVESCGRIYRPVLRRSEFAKPDRLTRRDVAFLMKQFGLAQLQA